MATNFIDYVKIHLSAGNGGAGSTHFRREKYVPKGGADGGDGGRGGHIILRGNSQLSTLLHLKYTKHVRAENGGRGGGNHRKGADGVDSIIEVPLGTLVKEIDTGGVIAEVTHSEEEKILLRGGRGGKGNSNFKSATRQTPLFSQSGEQAEEKTIALELKLIADIGMIGPPSAGKSTLLSRLSAAKPVIAPYDFTTLTPQLGSVSYDHYHSFVLAEIPGLIEGAAQGKGLGIRFLRHAERSKLLFFLIPADVERYDKVYTMLRKELMDHQPSLMDKVALAVISKCDLLSSEEIAKKCEALPPDLERMAISSFSQPSVLALKKKLWGLLHP